jgi:hypothetical protein
VIASGKRREVVALLPKRRKTPSAIALLAGCASPSPVAMATQDIAFIGGCWERHDAGNADFLRLLRDREHPGGSGVIWASTTGPSDELSIYAPAQDLPEEDRAVPLNGKAAFFMGPTGTTLSEGSARRRYA